MQTPPDTKNVFLRILYLEFRKLIDTRASRWVLGSLGVLALTVAALAALAFSSDGTMTFEYVIGAMQSAMALAMAVIGIMGMTGDWTHRVTTNYYPLVRSRTLIYAAKICATLLMSGALLGLLFLATLSILGIFSVSRGQQVSLSGLGEGMAVAGFVTLLATVFGIGVASIVRKLALSLVLVVLLSVGINSVALTVLPEILAPVFSTLTPLILISPPEGESVAGWQILSSVLLWYIVPLFAGWKIAQRVEA